MLAFVSAPLNIVLVLLCTALSGVLDARGFVYASRAWPGGQIDWPIGLLAIGSFLGGLSLYVVAVRFLQAAGISSVALQSGVWFVVTAVGIAAFDGSMLQWSRPQQIVALVIAIGLGWLIVTTRANAS
jgi:hypothetical protein